MGYTAVDGLLGAWWRRRVLRGEDQAIGELNLETLVLDFDNHSSDFITRLETGTPLVSRLSQGITLPKLRTLRVKRCKRVEEIEHLQFIQAPALQNLVVELDRRGNSWIPNAYAELWWRPLMKEVTCLRTLYLSNMDFHTGALTNLKIHEIPSLVHLTLRSVERLHEFFGNCGPFNNDPTAKGGRPFPSLQELHLLEAEPEFDFSLVFNLVKDRRPHQVATLDDRRQLVFEGPSDTLTSVVVMYRALDADLAARHNFYGMAKALKDAGVAVAIGGPLRSPPTRKRKDRR
ncbi:hypothetical protein NMY22_g5260 [Coprinellus aureogranulatus]|nr:hypothetical protein NMY22_g5260 [Coprinellus aureogranulatus]